jgi:hypothetical protein
VGQVMRHLEPSPPACNDVVGVVTRSAEMYKAIRRESDVGSLRKASVKHTRLRRVRIRLSSGLGRPTEYGLFPSGLSAIPRQSPALAARDPGVVA